MSRVFFTSDLHLGHANIIKYAKRPFLNDVEIGLLKTDPKFRPSRESVARMDSVLIDNINKTVGEKDVLWFLGDFCFTPKGRYYEMARSYRDRIACQDIRFILGNHDTCEIKDLFQYWERLEDRLVISGFKFHLSHYAQVVWNKSHRGAISCHGHSHSSLEPWLDEHMPGHRSIDVGIDNAVKVLGEYRPFSFEEIITIMNKRIGYANDHHK